MAVIQTGVGDHYRERSWLERWTAGVRLSRAPRWLRALLKRLMALALRTMPGDHLTSRLPGGERVRVDSAYRHLGWNAEEYAAFKGCTRRGATVLDIGANVGAYTVLFAQWVGSSGRVYAFEPASASRAGLTRHVAINGFADRVTVRPEAITAKTGRQAFVDVATHGGNRLTTARDVGTVDVPVISIDEFCRIANLRPDVMKIDVEGAELDVLRGARQTIAQRGSALSLFVELHPSTWPALGISRADVEAELRRQRLTIEPLPGVADPWTTEGVCVRVRSIA